VPSIPLSLVVLGRTTVEARSRVRAGSLAAVSDWPEPVERVASSLRAAGIEARIEAFHAGTGTAAEAARAVGCSLGQIVKSLVFVAGGTAAVVLVPGDRRADPGKVGRELGVERAHIASAEQVRDLTGFEPGAVAPFPLPLVERVLIYRALLTQAALWIGAGSPTHLAVVKPGDLLKLTGAHPMDAVERHG
jgi:prolyl-tRNA editing enzyme YbaK/EbsC (Cys-tRNA(Pro) deacylase)